jgi:hypothetical protein
MHYYGDFEAYLPFEIQYEGKFVEVMEILDLCTYEDDERSACVVVLLENFKVVQLDDVEVSRRSLTGVRALNNEDIDLPEYWVSKKGEVFTSMPLVF